LPQGPLFGRFSELHHLLYAIGVAVIAATIFGLFAHWLRSRSWSVI
jgi:hypothetical protein